MSLLRRLIKRKSVRLKSRQQILLQEKHVPFSLIKANTVKGAYLKISATGLEVVVPLHYSADKISQLIKEKESWIIKNLQKISKQNSNRRHFQDGLTLNVLGELQTVHVYFTANKRARISENQNEINVFIPQNFKSQDQESFKTHHPGYLSKAKKEVETFLRLKGKKYFEKRTHELSKIMQTNYGTITVRDQKTRWGSCSRANNLNFNWRLIFMPLDVIDYIIIHELAHTVHHNHSIRFHALVKKYCPNYQDLRKWLKQHQYVAQW